MLDSVKFVVSNQTPKVRDADGFFYMTFAVGVSSNNATLMRVKVKDGEGFPLLTDAIKALPKNTSNKTAVELCSEIKFDYQRGFGNEFPDLGIVANTSSSFADKPFASYVGLDGQTRYIHHPDVLRKVRLI